MDSMVSEGDSRSGADVPKVRKWNVGWILRGGDQDDGHSTTENLFLMTEGAISWLSKKQALLTSKAEYVALSHATHEAVWLRRLLTDLRTAPNGPMALMEDNQGAIAIARNPTAHARMKHIDIHYHYVHEVVQEGTIDLCYCPTNEMIVDLLSHCQKDSLKDCG